MAMKNYKNFSQNLILGYLTVATILTLSSGVIKIKNVPTYQNVEVAEILPKYDFDTVFNFYVIEVQNNFTNNYEIRIVKAINSKYGNEKGYVYYDVFSEEKIAYNNYTIINEESLFNYLELFNEFKNEYTYNDLIIIYNKIYKIKHEYNNISKVRVLNREYL